jgi:hypothetical protein
LNFLIVDASGPALQALQGPWRGRDPMEAKVRQTRKFGDLVVTAFDSAAQCSTDPAEVSRLARQMVMHVLRHSRSTFASPPGWTHLGGRHLAAEMKD